MTLFASGGSEPRVDPSAVVAPTAVVCGDVTVGPDTQVGFGAVIVAEGSPIVIGRQCIVRDNVVIRSTGRHAVHVGDHVLVGPRSVLFGCRVEDEAFLATGATVFHGAVVGARAEIRINGVLHLRSVLPAGATVPIGWVAVGDPARLLSPDKHEEIWAIQKDLDFPGTVYGIERESDGSIDMKEVTRRLAQSHRVHAFDRVVTEE